MESPRKALTHDVNVLTSVLDTIQAELKRDQPTTTTTTTTNQPTQSLTSHPSP
jgi:hypothetical protein